MADYTIQYRHKGRDYTMGLEADSHEDARARLNAAYFNGETQELVWSQRAPSWFGRFIERISG